MAQQDGDSAPIVELLTRMQAVASSSRDVSTDQSARAQLLQLSREMTASLEQPDEVCSNVAFSVCRSQRILSSITPAYGIQGGRYMCVRVADDLKLFDHLEAKSPRSTKELAVITGAEEGLLLRLLRTASGMGFARQIGPREFAATAVSMQMTKASVRAGLKFL